MDIRYATTVAVVAISALATAIIIVAMITLTH